MTDLFSQTEEPQSLVGYCSLWKPEILWLNMTSDLIVSLACLIMPLLLFRTLKRIYDPVLKWWLWMFMVLMCLSGIVSGLRIWNIWHAHFLVEGFLKATTAGSAIATATLMIPVSKRLWKLGKVDSED